MTISPRNAADSPNTMADCSCTSICAGLTTEPQSTTAHTRCTTAAPSLIETSATSPTMDPNASCRATPKARIEPSGAEYRALRQFDSPATRSSTARNRGASASRLRRNCTSSNPAAAAISSMKHSLQKALPLFSTERQYPTGMGIGS